MLDLESAQNTFADKTAAEELRMQAAELLMYCDEERTKSILFEVINDTTEEMKYRLEAAGVLSFLWAEGEIDYEMLLKIPADCLEEALSYLEMRNIKLQKNMLEGRVADFKAIYKARIL